MDPGPNPKTLYVGNLHPSITDDLLLALFGQIGEVKGCKIIVEPGSDPYAFVEFGDSSSAQAALLAMNKRSCLGREMKVNWATSPGNAPKTDTSKHFHIFVGDLSPDIETHQLKEAFTPFGDISDCKIIRDAVTLKSKGYGFVSFIKKEDAEIAIQQMNGQWLGSRAIRANWATRKPNPPSEFRAPKKLHFEEVMAQASPTNCTVYCGGVLTGLSDDLVRETFGHYGQIAEVRVFKEKGFAFIKFMTKRSAAEAIVGLQGSEIAGHVCKCAWGKEAGDPSSAGFGGSGGGGGQYGGGAQYSQGGYYNNQPMQQGGYWYNNPQAGYAMQSYGGVPYGGQQGYNYQYQGMWGSQAQNYDSSQPQGGGGY